MEKTVVSIFSYIQLETDQARSERSMKYTFTPSVALTFSLTPRPGDLTSPRSRVSQVEVKVRVTAVSRKHNHSSGVATY